MPWFVAVGVIVLLAALAALFVVHARAIRRDVEERFDRFQSRLEEEATSVFRDALKDNERS
jgi:hypothetical protein